MLSGHLNKVVQVYGNVIFVQRVIQPRAMFIVAIESVSIPKLLHQGMICIDGLLTFYRYPNNVGLGRCILLVR